MIQPLSNLKDSIPKIIGIISTPSNNSEGVFVLKSSCIRGISYVASNLSRDIELPFTLNIYSLIPGTSFYHKVSTSVYDKPRSLYRRIHFREYLDSVKLEFCPNGFFTM